MPAFQPDLYHPESSLRSYLFSGRAIADVPAPAREAPLRETVASTSDPMGHRVYN